MKNRSALIVLLALLAIVAAWAIVARPWLPLRYGRLDPPALEGAAVEPPVARLVESLAAEVREAPYSAEAWGRLGAAFDLHDLNEEAIVCYERAQELDPSDFRWPHLQGRCLRIGDQQAALVQFARATALNPEYATALVYAGHGYALTEQWEAAASVYAAAARLEPSLVRAHLGLAEVALARGDTVAAREHLTRAEALAPNEGEVHRLLAEAHRRNGDLDRAAAHARKAETDRPLAPVPDPVRAGFSRELGVGLQWRRARSAEYLARGEIESAIAEWEAALAADPDSVDARAELGAMYSAGKRLQDARAMYEQALALAPERHTLRNDYGALLFRLGLMEEGVAEIRRAGEGLPDNPDIQFNLAMASKAQGEDEAAVAAFERALALEPAHLRARFEYGVQLAKINRFDEAIEAFRGVIERDPARVSAVSNLVRALLHERRYAEAVDALQAARALEPDQIRWSRDLAWILATCPEDAIRDGATALRILEPLCVRAQYQEPTLLDALAAAAAETGDYEAAIRHGRQAVAIVAAAATTTSDARFALLLEALRSRVASYERGEPYRESRVP